MGKKRLEMRQIKEVLRKHFELELSQRSIAKSTGIPRSTIKDYLVRFKVAKLSWPLTKEQTDDWLEQQLFPVPPKPSSRIQPDWQYIHEQLKRKGVTLQLLWEEYKQAEPTGYQYSWFAECYRTWAKKKEVWMPLTHKAGESLFVDYSGLKHPVWHTNLQTVDYEAEIFVGVLGASDLIFCVATQSQQLEDWINAHNLMFEYYQGVSALLIPDNLRSGVTKAHRYEPLCNRTYEDLAGHYNCAIMPARSNRPKDKAKVEKAVQTIQQRILASLRESRFVNLSQLNQAIADKLNAVNDRPFQKFPYSRRELFEKIEKEALIPLPPCPSG